MLFPPLDKKNMRDKAKGLLGHVGEAYRGAGVRYLHNKSRGGLSATGSYMGSPTDQYRFAHPPSTSPRHAPLLRSSSAPPRERAIKSVFCAANLPTIMYFFSVISPLSEAQLSAEPHTTHYNTDNFLLTPTTDETIYPPNLIMQKGIYLRRFSG